MDKLLTVIVPVYNVESYLEKCVDSILAQSYSNLELILIDDGSPDKCPEICDRYEKKDSRVKVIHQKNAGQGAARNRGIDIAKGEYIAFADSDDFLNKNMYSVMIEAMERTDSDLSLCGMITHSGIRLANSVIPETELIMNGPEEILRYYLTTPYVGGGPCNKVFRKHIFETIRFPEGVAREDVYIMHHLLDNCTKAVHVADRLYNFIIREGSSEHQAFHPKFLISIQIADERCQLIREKYPDLIKYAEKACFGSRISAVKKIVRSNAVKEYRETYNELVTYIKNNEAPTKEYKKLKTLIVHFPVLYKLKLDFNHKYRKAIKNLVIQILKK